SASEPSPASEEPAPATAGSPDLAAVALELEPVVELDAPTALAIRPGDEEALYIAERGGRVVRVADDGAAATALDISDQTTSDGERGLLGLDFSEDGSRLYVSYTNLDGDTRLDECRMDGNSA